VRQKSRRDGRTVLSSLPGIGNLRTTKPSAKALGYYRKPVRAGIFVDMKLKNEFSAVGAEYAAPTGLDFVLVCGSTKMPRLRRCLILKICVSSVKICG
jgi:hypothetical protein